MYNLLNDFVTELSCLTSWTYWITMAWQSIDSVGTGKLSFLFGNHCIPFINPESTSLLMNLGYWSTNVTNALVRKSIAMRMIDILWPAVGEWRAVWSWCTLLCYLCLLGGVMRWFIDDLWWRIPDKHVWFVKCCPLSSSSGRLLTE